MQQGARAFRISRLNLCGNFIDRRHIFAIRRNRIVKDRLVSGRGFLGNAHRLDEILTGRFGDLVGFLDLILVLRQNQIAACHTQGAESHAGFADILQNGKRLIMEIGCDLRQLCRADDAIHADGGGEKNHHDEP